MRSLKIFGWFLLSAIAIVAILAWLLPTKQHIEKSLTINAPAKTLYEQISKLETFNRFSVWSQNDSLLQNTISGNDGTVGAVNSWKGDPEISGEGKMEITELKPNESIQHHITFISPRKAEAESSFILQEKNGQTTITWNFDLLTPRPWNVLNSFSGLDKKMGKDFDQGLANLKSLVEKRDGKEKEAYEVKQMNFPSTTYAMYRQVVKMDEIQKFFALNLQAIFSEIQKSGATPGVLTGLYYSWDEGKQETDMAAAIPIPAGTILSDPTITVENITASKAVYVDYYGTYDKLISAYNSIDKYLADKKLKQKSPAIEQYITDPQTESDSSKWHTRIIFLVE
jgi:effector-binding domain-containing protein